MSETIVLFNCFTYRQIHSLLLAKDTLINYPLINYPIGILTYIAQLIQKKRIIY